LLFAVFAGGCEDAPPPKNPFDPPADRAVQPPPLKEPLKPTGPPDLAIDNISPKVGFARVNFNFPDGRTKLAAELALNRQHFEGKETTLRVDRKAKPNWVSAYLAELGNIGVSRVLVKTETRSEYSPEVVFTPERHASAAPSCSVVAMILEDRGTAVWKLSGGAAGKRPKGMAGPDLTMTGDTVERVAKACRAGPWYFVSAAKDLEWGLVYDLAASSKVIQGTRFEGVVLLSQVPVPGHKVDVSP